MNCMCAVQKALFQEVFIFYFVHESLIDVYYWQLNNEIGINSVCVCVCVERIEKDRETESIFQANNLLQYQLVS